MNLAMPPAEKPASEVVKQYVPKATTPASVAGSPGEQQPTASPAVATAQSADPLLQFSQHPEAAVAGIPGGGTDDGEGTGARKFLIECECRTAVISCLPLLV